MHPASEYFRLKQQFTEMTARADAMRAGFLSGALPAASNTDVVRVRQQRRRVFKRDRLPPKILSDPRYWDEAVSPVVTVRSTTPLLAEEEFELLERW